MTATYEPEEILKDFLRKRMVSDDPRSSRHTTKTYTLNGTSGEQTIDLSGQSSATIQFINMVTLDATAKKKYVDYEYDLRSKTVTIYASSAGTNNLTITWYENSTDWIYTDQPRIESTTSAYPRIRVWKTDENADRLGSEATTTPAGFGGTVTFQVDVYFRNQHEGFTMGGKYRTNEEITKYLARKVVEHVRNYINDMYPKLHSFSVLSNRPFEFDQERQSYRHIINLQAQSEVIGQ